MAACVWCMYMFGMCVCVLVRLKAQRECMKKREEGKVNVRGVCLCQ